MNVWALISAIELLIILLLGAVAIKMEQKLGRAKTAIEDYNTRLGVAYNDRLGREYGSE